MTSTASALPARTLRAKAAAMGERQRLPVQTKSRVGTPACYRRNRLLKRNDVAVRFTAPPGPSGDRCLTERCCTPDHAARKCCFTPVHDHSGASHAHKPFKF